MTFCSSCRNYFSEAPFTLLDNRTICGSCFEKINSERGPFPLPNPPKPPEKPGFLGWIFSSGAREDYYHEMRKYDHLKEIYYKENDQIRELNNKIVHDICAFWPGGHNPPDWDWRRQKVIDRDLATCQQCGRRSRYSRYRDRIPENPSIKTWRRTHSLTGFHVHHIKSRFTEGTHELSNLILLCERCHRRKPKSKKK